MIPLSVLDLSPIVQGGTAAESLHNSLDLARHAERLGYQRYWVAEHHNMPGIASAATALVIGYLAAGTETIRVGAGGIMLPNHAPLLVAEQFGTLETLHPGRIDLGLGRAPGTDQVTVRALRRTPGAAESFPEDVVELMGYLGPARPGQAVLAVPGVGTRVPIWLLGSSLFSARLAAELGLPFAFASHFAPDYLLLALKLYREQFKPSEALAEPHAMVAVNAFAADSEEEAWRLSTSIQQMFAAIRLGKTGPLLPPLERLEGAPEDWERAIAQSPLAVSVIGTAETIRVGLEALVEQTGADELIVTSHVFDHQARKRSFEIVAQAWGLPAAD